MHRRGTRSNSSSTRRGCTSSTSKTAPAFMPSRSSKQKEIQMRKRVGAIVAVAALVAAGCGGSSSGGKKQTGGTSNLTGTISMMSAGESNETDAYQVIFNDLINSKVKYK